MRINIVLDSECFNQLEVLKYQEDLTTAEVIKKALDCYEKSRHDNRIKIQQLLASDFIGCVEDSELLYENYKDYLIDSKK